MLYQDLIRAGQRSPTGHLPPVLPLVLYNERPRWTAATELAALIEPPPAGLERYQPGLRYLLVEENRYGEAELAPLRNLSAALFRLENSRGPADVQRVVAALVDWLQAPEQASLRRAFATWLRRVLLPARLPGMQLEVVRELSEVRDMLAERVLEWTEEWKQQGLQQGEVALLQRLLERKFGPLDEATRMRLTGADAGTLLIWGERVLDARSLAAVFEDRAN